MYKNNVQLLVALNRMTDHHDGGNSRRVGVRVETWPENQALFAKSDIVNHQIGTSDHNRVGFWIKRGAGVDTNYSYPRSLCLLSQGPRKPR